MNNIKIIDDFFSKDEIENINNIMINANWGYGHKSNNNDPEQSPFWFIELIHDEYFSVYLKKKIESVFNKTYQLNRVYAVGQTFGQDGSYHTDDIRKDCFTFCLYINTLTDKIIDKYDGYLHIKIPNEKYIITIEPIMNRGVLFPSVFFHKGCAFNKLHNSIRICIAWKLCES
jgi:hypothetical protein